MGLLLFQSIVVPAIQRYMVLWHKIKQNIARLPVSHVITRIMVRFLLVQSVMVSGLTLLKF